MTHNEAKEGDFVKVKATVFGRGGQRGYIVATALDGATLDFMDEVNNRHGRPFSIEFYRWQELER